MRDGLGREIQKIIAYPRSDALSISDRIIYFISSSLVSEFLLLVSRANISKILVSAFLGVISDVVNTHIGSIAPWPADQTAAIRILATFLSRKFLSDQSPEPGHDARRVHVLILEHQG